MDPQTLTIVSTVIGGVLVVVVAVVKASGVTRIIHASDDGHNLQDRRER